MQNYLNLRKQSNPFSVYNSEPDYTIANPKHTLMSLFPRPVTNGNKSSKCCRNISIIKLLISSVAKSSITLLWPWGGLVIVTFAKFTPGRQIIHYFCMCFLALNTEWGNTKKPAAPNGGFCLQTWKVGLQTQSFWLALITAKISKK